VLSDLLRKYDTFVKNQGAETLEIKNRGITEDSVDYETRVYVANLYGKPRAILVRTTETGWGEPSRRFVGYVPPELESMARKKTESLFGKVEEMDPGTITGHIPAP